MTQEQIEILKSGADLLISTISNTINSKPEQKKEGREYLKKVIAASEELDKIKVEN